MAAVGRPEPGGERENPGPRRRRELHPPGSWVLPLFRAGAEVCVVFARAGGPGTPPLPPAAHEAPKGSPSLAGPIFMTLRGLQGGFPAVDLVGRHLHDVLLNGACCSLVRGESHVDMFLKSPLHKRQMCLSPGIGN